MNEKRWKVIEASPELLLYLVLSGAVITTNRGEKVALSTDPEVPEEARLHHAYYDQREGTFNVVVEHGSFEVVSEGSQIPHVLVTATAIQ